jgi:hypothetical protein
MVADRNNIFQLTGHMAGGTSDEWDTKRSAPPLGMRAEPVPVTARKPVGDVSLAHRQHISREHPSCA